MKTAATPWSRCCGAGSAARAFRPDRWWLAWVLTAWVLATLAPGVSRIWTHASASAGADWVEVCTSHGMDRVRADGSPVGSVPAEPGAVLDACGHCTLALDRLASPMPRFEWAGLTLPPLVPNPGVAGALPGLRAARPHARGPPHTS